MKKRILDMCCGSRMFYFDKHDPNVLFTDIREYHDTLCDGRKLDVQPDMIADCTDLPFEDETFNMVVFDPPHLQKVGQNSWLCKKYGKLPENWQAFINDSIHEGMRVLKTNGTLIFKWNEQQIKVSDILKAITDYKPIFGHRTTIKNQTIWMAFMTPFPAILSLVPQKEYKRMTKEEYEEMRNTIDSVGKYFNSIEELTIIRDLVEEVDASNEMAILISPVKLDISLQGISSDGNEDITKYLNAETILYIRNAILRRLNSRIAFFESQIENINYTKRKTKKK